MKRFNENMKSFIKIFKKIKNKDIWSHGIWESHPEWSDVNNDLNIIFNLWNYNEEIPRISITIDNFLDKYETIYNLIYN